MVWHCGKFSNLPCGISHIAIYIKLNITLALEQPGEVIEVLVA